MAADGERHVATPVHRQIWMTIAMTMRIKFDPSIVLAFLTWCAQPAASPAQASLARLRWWLESRAAGGRALFPPRCRRTEHCLTA
jgi:hypothetical protein